MSKTKRHQPEPKPKPRQIKQERMRQAMLPPPVNYPEPEAPPYKPMG